MEDRACPNSIPALRGVTLDNQAGTIPIRTTRATAVARARNGAVTSTQAEPTR